MRSQVLLDESSVIQREREVYLIAERKTLHEEYGEEEERVYKQKGKESKEGMQAHIHLRHPAA